MCSDPHAVGHMVSEKDWSSWLHIYWHFRISCAFGMCHLQPLHVMFLASDRIIYCSTRFFFQSLNPASYCTTIVTLYCVTEFFSQRSKTQLFPVQLTRLIEHLAPCPPPLLPTPTVVGCILVTAMSHLALFICPG